MRLRSLLVLLAVTLLASSVWAQSAPTTITTVAGGGPNNVPATTANLEFNYSAMPDSSGNVFIPDLGRCAVFKVDSSGILTVFAGQLDQCGFGGDNGPATSAMLNGPSNAIADGSGNVFIADTTNNRIRRVDHLTGFITTYAGNGVKTYGGDNGPATSASLNLNPGNAYFNGLALDSAGDLFIADTFNSRVRRVDTSATPIITTYAGNGTQGFSGDGSAATQAELSDPNGLAFDAATGDLYIADLGNQRVRVVDSALNINTVAGTGTAGYNGDNMLATSAELNGATGVAVDSTGDLYISEIINNRIRRVDHSTQIITTVGGNGTGGFSGDGNAATSAEISYPVGVSVDAAGDVFIGDTSNLRVREIYCINSAIPCTPPAGLAAGDINTFAGNGFPLYSGDGVPATGACLYNPRRVTADAAGDLFIVDTENYVIRRVDAGTKIITTIAGTPGISGYTGDNGPATSAQLTLPLDVALDAAGDIYIADPNASVVRRVDASTKIITTVAGNGTYGYNGDGIAATTAFLRTPIGVAFNAAGDLLIADANNNRVRRVDHATQLISTIAGNGIAGFGGDNGPATSASLHFPEQLVFDSAGNLFIADNNNARIRRVDATTGFITTVAGSNTAGFAGDGMPATSAELNNPMGVTLDVFGSLFISDFSNNRVRRVDVTSQIINTVAGNGTAGLAGDGGPATSAELNALVGAAVDPGANLYIADQGNLRIRAILNPGAALYPSPIPVAFGSQAQGSSSAPVILTFSNTGHTQLVITGLSLGGANAADFTQVAGGTCGAPPITVNAGASCTIQGRYTPSTSAAESATLFVTDNAPNSPQPIGLMGAATSTVLFSPTSLAFPSTQMGSSSAAMPVTLTNSGTSPLTIAVGGISFTGTNPGDFSETDNCPTGTNSLAAGGFCTINVTFTPTATGTRSASLSVTDNATGSPQTVPVAGIGTAAGTCGTATWIGVTGGQWGTATNWSSGAVPVSTDDVCIPAGFSVTVGALVAPNLAINSLNVQGSSTLNFNGGPLTVASVSSISNLSVTGGTITFSGDTGITTALSISSGTANFNGPATASTATFTAGTLGGSGNLAISGAFTWNGGTISTTGVVTADGALTVNGGLLSAGTLTSNAGSTLAVNGLTMASGAVFNNAAGSTFNMQNGSGVFSTGGAIFNNAGTVLFSTSLGSGSIAALLNNTGMVNVTAGTLALQAGGTGNGAYTVASGATLIFQNLTYALGGTVSGAGTVQFTNATVNLTGSYNVTGATNVTSGTANFTGTVPSVGALAVSGGTANFSSTTTPLAVASLAITAPGTLTGTNSLTVSGAFTWDGGTLSTTGAVTANGAITLNGTNQILSATTLTSNAGTTLSASVNAFLTMQNGAVFNNAAGSTFDIQDNAGVSLGGGAAVFNNAGTLQHSTSAGTATISVALNNTGTVNVASGTLQLVNGGSGNGAYTAAAGTTLNFGGGTFAVGGMVSGAGTVTFSSGTANVTGTYNVTGATMVTGGIANFTGPLTATGPLTISAGTANFSSATNPITVPSLTFSAGTLTGTNSLTITGLFTFNGGIVQLTGSLTTTGGISIGSASAVVIGTTVASNSGVTMTGGAGLFLENGAVWNQAVGTTFDVQNAGGVFGSGAPAPVFNNAGTFQRSTVASNATLSIGFVNTGMLKVLTGTLTYSGGFDLTSGSGSIIISSGATLVNSGSNIDVSGAITGPGLITGSLNSNLNFHAGSSETNLTSITITSGTLSVDQGVTLTVPTLNLPGSALKAFGTITGNVSATNSATVVPGTSSAAAGITPGTLTINGNFTMDSTSFLAMGLGGTTPGVGGYSQLVVNSGTATLAGTLSVTNVGVFMPAAGNSFELIVPATLSGTFASTYFPAPPAGSTWGVTYNAATAGGVVLAATPVAVADFTLSAMPSPLTVAAGTSGSYTATVAPLNGFTGTVSLSVSGLPAGATSTTATVTGGTGTAMLSISTSASTPAGSYSLTITGTSGTLSHTASVTLVVTQPLVALAASLSFPGTVAVGSSSSQMLTLTNSGPGPLTFAASGAFAITGANAAAFSQMNTCPAAPVTLAAGMTCTITVTFKPAAPDGTKTATLTVTDNASNSPQTVMLTGQGATVTATLSTASINFGAVPVGTQPSPTMQVTVSSSVNIGLNITGITITGPQAADYKENDNCNASDGGIGADSSCTITVTFTPTVTTLESATLTITDNATSPGPQQTVSLLGGMGAGFTLTVPPPASGGTGLTITVLPGDTAVYTVLITCTPGVTGTITLAGLAPLPPNTILTITPSMITCPSSMPVTVQVKLQTNCVPSLVAPWRPVGPGNGPGLPGSFGALWVAAVLLAAGMRRPGSCGMRHRWARQMAPVCAAVVLAVLVMTWTACVSNLPPAIPNAPTTPAGNYPLTIVATGPSGAQVTVVFTVHVI